MSASKPQEWEEYVKNQKEKAEGSLVEVSCTTVPAAVSLD